MRQPWYSIFYIRSPIAKIGWALIGVIASVAILAFQFVIEEPRMAAQGANFEGRGTEIGANLFANNCASCHAADGKGLPGVAPALHSRYFFEQRLADVGWAGNHEQYVKLTLHAGRPSKTSTQWAQIMPTWGNTFGGPMRADQIEHLTNYVLNWEETSLLQTPEEDPWQFYRDALSRGLPYAADEPGYEAKLQAGLDAALLAGAINYELEGVALEVPEGSGAVASGPRAPEQLFASMACAGCHNLNELQSDDSLGQPGPHFGNLAEIAASRVEGEDAATYIYNSITNPNGYVVPGYVQNIMPQNFGETMTEEEIQSMVAWLLE